jgi:hypothetical protein
MSPSFWCASVLRTDGRVFFAPLWLSFRYWTPAPLCVACFVSLWFFRYCRRFFVVFLLLDPMRSRFCSASFIYFLQSWCDLSVSLWFFRWHRCFPRDLPPGSDESVLFSVSIFLSVFRSCGTEFGFPLYSSLIWRTQHVSPPSPSISPLSFLMVRYFSVVSDSLRSLPALSSSPPVYVWIRRWSFLQCCIWIRILVSLMTARIPYLRQMLWCCSSVPMSSVLEHWSRPWCIHCFDAYCLTFQCV